MGQPLSLRTPPLEWICHDRRVFSGGCLCPGPSTDGPAPSLQPCLLLWVRRFSLGLAMKKRARFDLSSWPSQAQLPLPGRRSSVPRLHPGAAPGPCLPALSGHALDLVQEARIAQGLVQRQPDVVDRRPFQVAAEQRPVGLLPPGLPAPESAV